MSGNVKDLVAAELSKYNKSTIEYVSLYCRPYVYYDDDLNPIITNRQKIAAHLIKKLNIFDVYNELKAVLKIIPPDLR